MHTNRSLLHKTPSPFRHAGAHTAMAGEDYPLHRDNYWELMYLRTGHIQCQQGATLYDLHPGMVILHPPQISHRDFAHTAYTTFYLWIDAPIDTRWRPLYHDNEDHSLERICRDVLREWRSQDVERERMLALLGSQMELLLDRNATADTSAAQRAVTAAVQIMEERYHLKLTIHEVAKEIGVCTSSLQTYFAQRQQTSPLECLQAIRLHHALALLHHSTRTLDAIATMTGYNSASHLSRHVKAATGTSPGRLRCDVTSEESKCERSQNANCSDLRHSRQL